MRVIASRILTIVTVLAQGIILDSYIILFNGASWLPWITADVITVFVLLFTYAYSHHYYRRFEKIEQNENHRVKAADWKQGPKMERPPAVFPLIYFSWLVYSCFLVAKISIIFKTFGPDLSGEEVWGTNLLEFTIAGTAGIFAFFVTGRERRPTASQKVCLKFMQHHVLLEIIDCVEFLTILFTSEHRLMVPRFVTDMILAFACINLILPTLGLYQLSATNFRRKKPQENFYIIQTIMSTIFGNMPYLIIRVFLWTDHKFTNALFVMKNIIAICQNVMELIHYYTRDKAHSGHEKSKKTDKHLAEEEEDLDLHPQPHHQHIV